MGSDKVARISLFRRYPSLESRDIEQTVHPRANGIQGDPEAGDDLHGTRDVRFRGLST